VKVGEGRREGELVSVDGRAVRVRRDDGTESLLFPGPGVMRVVTPASARPRGTGGSRPTGASGTIRSSAKLGSSKRTKAAGGDFREEKKSGVERVAGAGRGAGRAGGSKPGASEPAAARGAAKKRTARTAPAVERAVVRTVGSKEQTKKKTIGRAASKKKR
jgi:hypothetical protein